MTNKPKIRLYVDEPLHKEQSLTLSKDHAHYLASVMRQKIGANILLFNGVDGEWMAEIIDISKRAATVRIIQQTKPQRCPPDVWLYFAPIKKARTDFIVEKATELGAAKICPVQTAYTNAERIRQQRLQAHAIEAAEQCGETYVPQVCDLQKLDAVLANWPEDRNLLFCDETLTNVPTSDLKNGKGDKWAIITGPEGGFSETEITKLRTMPQTCPISLGPRILRADTAVVAALTLWQNALGDWS